VFKSSFLLLSVALLTAAANLQNGGVRWEQISASLRGECRADLRSLHEDAITLRTTAGSTMSRIRALWIDTTTR